MTFTHRSATEIADLLDNMGAHRHVTGMLSMLDEATTAFGGKYEHIRTLQREFSGARRTHMRSYDSTTKAYSEDAWKAAMQAAHALADALRPLGDECIARCNRPADWGTCGLPLDLDGTCPGNSHKE